MCHMTHGCEICNVRCMWLTSDHSATVAILLKTLGTQEKMCASAYSKAGAVRRFASVWLVQHMMKYVNQWLRSMFNIMCRTSEVALNRKML